MKTLATVIGVVGRALGDRVDLAPLMPICAQSWPLVPFFLNFPKSAYGAKDTKKCLYVLLMLTLREFICSRSAS
ncbi:hypothetical protein [Hydrogenophaga sp. OTU3427]|uniref:hypothetical protein n=1 Tax=Hydrogenophaga sp. OTU3427 TaxID=3043856 RepID=UPI00313A810A